MEVIEQGSNRSNLLDQIVHLHLRLIDVNVEKMESVIE